MKHYLIAGAAGVLAGYFLGKKLAPYTPFKQAYLKGGGPVVNTIAS